MNQLRNTAYITQLRILGWQNIVSVLGQEEGFTVKYTPSPEGVSEGEARGTLTQCSQLGLVWGMGH